jgi:hypothetical protein
MTDTEKKVVEEWREIPGLSGYLVSNLGRIKSLNYRRKGKEQVLKHQGMSNYEAVCICGKTYYVHRLVAMAFIANPKNKTDVNHINCNTHDNRAENLEWATRDENLIKYFNSEKFKKILESQKKVNT